MSLIPFVALAFEHKESLCDTVTAAAANGIVNDTALGNTLSVNRNASLIVTNLAVVTARVAHWALAVVCARFGRISAARYACPDITAC